MSITVTIPLWPFALYLLIGLIGFLPLLAWANSQVSRRSWYEGWNRWPGVVASTLLWPVIIWQLYITPKRNRKALESFRRQREQSNM